MENMKKETFMLGLLLVISLAVVAQKNNYSIVGTITGYDGAYVKMHNKETNEDKVIYDSLVAIYDAYTQQMKDYVDSVGWLTPTAIIRRCFMAFRVFRGCSSSTGTAA